MTWIAISEGDHHYSRPDAAIVENGVLPRGTLLIETRLSAEGRPQNLLSFERLHPQPYKFALHAIPGGGLALVVANGNDVFHTALSHDSRDRADILRISYSWDLHQRKGRLAIERPEYETVKAVTLEDAPALLAEDVVAITVDPRRRCLDRDVSFFAVSDQVEPVGPAPTLSPDVPILTQTGYQPAGTLRRGDLVDTMESGLVPVLQAVSRVVPSCGSFQPVRLRAPYFGLLQDILVAPDQRLVVGGSEVEYTFGREAVLVPARHLVNGTSAIRTSPGPVVRYCQLVMPRHESLVAAGCLVESLYLGRLRRNPDALAHSLLAGTDRAHLPEHARSSYSVVRPFEAVTLMMRRAA
ncbi:Hint domain-containing protein [Rhodalgimonas zhirmunskyi]|uniref:Hint domain-containing protein n=1 Tax=Rhodalgimonas zhirmunskyi TaxID=2964767 RepID=A0AAJ1X8P3_9RHOB|nr:Hint domain-containing protein [Rhodoalgimonas zhirmunskyi]MDQ2095857.1 Hint domain-containing protein [Rhodoalgimonas zhirmunskyi]